MWRSRHVRLNLKNKKLGMKNLKNVFFIVLAIAALAFTSCADNQNQKTKPYPLKTCLVCGMDLGPGKPYVFVYKGQEIKLCDESERAIFDKDADNYLKQLADAEAKLKE
jgi:hypothetical protein